MPNTFDYNATLVKRTDVTDTLSVFLIKSDQLLSEFKPGQFTMVGLKPEAIRCELSEPEAVKRKDTDVIIRRAYSICSDPSQVDTYEIYLSLVKAGELTSRLFHLKEGDRLWNSGKPAGLFTLDYVKPEKGLLMFSTGTGIAPFISMVRKALRENSDRKMMLLNAIDVSNQLGYRQELEGFTQKFSNFKYLPVVTFPDRDLDWKGLTGWVQDDIRNRTYENETGWQLTPKDFQVLLCGNPAMIKAGIEALTEKGFVQGKSKDPTASIFIEEYW
jgi:ferredoxin/flavodoxin---NADP+ reductase